MSRVGNVPVTVPDGVDVTVDGRRITAKGKLGELSYELTESVTAAFENAARQDLGRIVVDHFDGDAILDVGIARSLVTGVSQGFTKQLEINGVGYRAAVHGATLGLQLGYSHDINYAIPEGITITCEKPTSITVSGADKQKVGQVAAEIRSYRPPEPYKGKGIKYVDEVVLRKEGKKK